MKFKDSIIFDYICIVVGSFIVALSLNFFLVPNKIAPGGVSGIATITYYLWKFPVGVTMLIINIPLFIFGIKLKGGQFGIRTFIAAVLLSLFTDLVKVSPLTRDPILSAIYGGVLMGIGLGMVFRANATTGGTDLFAAIIHSHWPIIGVNWVMFLIDFLVVLVAGIVFGPSEALYALVCLFLTAKVIDMVQEGINSSKAFFVISDHAEEIAGKILKDMDRGATILNGTGAYTRLSKNVILCVISRREVVRLKEIINEMDPNAFVLVTDVREVMGEGF
ncbi:MAG: YitT family protein [Xylanivirga thermophila]|jgi:uncharacterized membrane-anchored protein YitT (DUF2179 family)|uniref:YitT family protein n=1 Tax=Xylanivirga thermophila TaxID=2496273 RepID=UPI0039F647D3